jgi:hypothetical protein
MNGFEILQANPNVVQALKTHQASFADNATTITQHKPKSHAKSMNDKPKLPSSKSKAPAKGSRTPN